MKNKVDIKTWKEFRIGDLFDIHPTKAYKMNNSSLLEENGKNPVIVNSSYNNGVGGYSNLECTEKGNIVTFSDTTSADSIFYQEDDFIGYPHVQGLYPIGQYKNMWNKYTYMFFITVFREKAKNLNYDYVNKFTRDSAKEIRLKLPIDINGKPDWSYMEQYMNDIEKEISDTPKKLLNIHNIENSDIETDTWKEFEIGSLFKIVSPKVYHTHDVQEEENGIPYVVRSKFNNGIKYTVKKEEHLILNPPNVISFGAENASFFYQEKEYVSGRDMYYIDTRHISKTSALFIIACLEKISSKYSYNYGLFPNLLKKEKIKLPVTKSGEPDYSYMDNYISDSYNIVNNKIKLLKLI